MKNEIITELLTDLAALTFVGGINCFGNVKTVYRNNQNPRDAILIPRSTPVVLLGNTSDERIYTFDLSLYEVIESTLSQSESEKRQARINNIEDAILNYLEKEPHNLVNSIVFSNGNITKVRVNSTDQQYVTTEQGISVALSIQFSVYVLITPQLL